MKLWWNDGDDSAVILARACTLDPGIYGVRLRCSVLAEADGAPLQERSNCKHRDDDRNDDPPLPPEPGWKRDILHVVD